MAFLVTQMIPAFIALGPLYVLMVDLQLVDSQGRPDPALHRHLHPVLHDHAARLLRERPRRPRGGRDGGRLLDGSTALFRVIVPVMTPGIMAAFIFNFVNCWNELFLSVTLMNSDSNKTIPTALNGFISSFNIEWGPMAAAAVLTIVPTMLMFALASRWIVAGAHLGGRQGLSRELRDDDAPVTLVSRRLPAVRGQVSRTAGVVRCPGM